MLLELLYHLSSGQAIDDDLIIITGIAKEITGQAQDKQSVKQAVIKLLKDELGLEIRPGYERTPTGSNNIDLSGLSNGSSEIKASFRRPQDRGMLRVTRESLQRWLQNRQYVLIFSPLLIL